MQTSNHLLDIHLFLDWARMSRIIPAAFFVVLAAVLVFYRDRRWFEISILTLIGFVALVVTAALFMKFVLEYPIGYIELISYRY